MESHRQYLANQKSLLVLITRVKDDLKIYTDNKDKLVKTILSNTGDKLSSLEVLGEHPRFERSGGKQPIKNFDENIITSAFAKELMLDKKSTISDSSIEAYLRDANQERSVMLPETPISSDSTKMVEASKEQPVSNVRQLRDIEKEI